MPLINGQKMACEPCIRGHRSTKCTHANERLMVPVRKPGRPLSTCPHPPARGCGCGSVTAAIPRKQKCGCGSSSGTPTTDSSSSVVKAESPASDAPPMSPTKAPASFRVQKTTAKSASRKQSFDPANLERMDAVNINILPPYDMAQANQMPHATGAMPGMPAPRSEMEYGPMPIMAGVNGGFHQPIMYPIFPQHMPASMFPHGATMPMPQTNGAALTTSTPTPASIPAPVATTNGGSCCSGKANGAAKPTPPPPSLTSASTGGSCCSGPGKAEGASTQPSSVSSSPKTQPKPKKDGCCSSKAPTIDTNVVTNGHHMSNGHMSPSPSSAIAMSPFQTPIGMPQGMYQSYFQPTIFTYPPQYGSFMSPLQPEQWKQTMEALQYGQPMPQPAAYNIPPNPLFTPDGTAPTVPESTSHTCSCGDGCQCVGCAAHPYNDATQDYVRSAYFSMQEDSYGVANGVNGVNGTNGHSEAAIANRTGAHGAEAHMNGDAGGSPPAPQTPSDAASGLSEEQALSASDFFFVTYPFSGEGCAGETLSCPCGDDCQCLGCSIHNNSPVLDP